MFAYFNLIYLAEIFFTKQYEDSFIYNVFNYPDITIKYASIILRLNIPALCKIEYEHRAKETHSNKESCKFKVLLFKYEKLHYKCVYLFLNKFKNDHGEIIKLGTECLCKINKIHNEYVKKENN